MVNIKKNFEKPNIGKEKKEFKTPENKEMLDRSFEQEKQKEREFQKNEKLVDLGAKEGEGELGGIVGVGNQNARLSERQKQIEAVLSDDLSEIYLKMSPQKQKEFKVKGEETARVINTMIDSTKFKIKKVINLIRDWLVLIPGINKFFLEQEVKIKTDKILKMHDNKG